MTILGTSSRFFVDVLQPCGRVIQQQVGQLGVKCILTPDGVSRQKFNEGLLLFQ
jgi:hypothetical protein